MSKQVEGKPGDAASSAPDPAARITVAYHDGPPQIGYYGHTWTRGVAQEMTATDWAAMRARSDFNQFDFKEEH